jgi:hypothetical protein
MRDAELFCDLIVAQVLGLKARGDGCDEFAAQAQVQGKSRHVDPSMYWYKYMSMPVSQYTRQLAEIKVPNSQLGPIPGDEEIAAQPGFRAPLLRLATVCVRLDRVTETMRWNVQLAGIGSARAWALRLVYC